MHLDEAVQYQPASITPAHQCSTETWAMPPTTADIQRCTCYHHSQLYVLQAGGGGGSQT